MSSDSWPCTPRQFVHWYKIHIPIHPCQVIVLDLGRAAAVSLHKHIPYHSSLLKSMFYCVSWAGQEPFCLCLYKAKANYQSLLVQLQKNGSRAYSLPTSAVKPLKFCP